MNLFFGNILLLTLHKHNGATKHQNKLRTSTTQYCHLIPLSSVPVSVHRAVVSLNLDYEDWFCFKEVADEWMTQFSSSPLDGTVSSHYAAGAALDSLIQRIHMRHCNPILNLLCAANVAAPVSSFCHPAISLTATSTPPQNSKPKSLLSWSADGFIKLAGRWRSWMPELLHLDSWKCRCRLLEQPRDSVLSLYHYTTPGKKAV